MGVRSVAGLPASVRSGLLWSARLLVVWAHRAHRIGVALCVVAVRARAGVVARLGERVLEAAQPVGREIEGFHVRAGFPQARSAVRARLGTCFESSEPGS